ncbi:MAG: M56 family metallopeptidase [Flavonifractor plautii]
MLRPVILLPKTLDRSDVSRLAFVLTHEMAHIRRFDALSKLLLAAAACLHWFNPLVWVMLVLANRDLELSCDAAVVRLYGAEARAPMPAPCWSWRPGGPASSPCAPLSTKTPWRSASAPSCAPAKPPPRRWPWPWCWWWPSPPCSPPTPPGKADRLRLRPDHPGQWSGDGLPGGRLGLLRGAQTRPADRPLLHEGAV